MLDSRLDVEIEGGPAFQDARCVLGHGTLCVYGHDGRSHTVDLAGSTWSRDGHGVLRIEGPTLSMVTDIAADDAPRRSRLSFLRKKPSRGSLAVPRSGSSLFLHANSSRNSIAPTPIRGIRLRPGSPKDLEKWSRELSTLYERALGNGMKRSLSSLLLSSVARSSSRINLAATLNDAPLDTPELARRLEPARDTEPTRRRASPSAEDRMRTQTISVIHEGEEGEEREGESGTSGDDGDNDPTIRFSITDASGVSSSASFASASNAAAPFTSASSSVESTHSFPSVTGGSTSSFSSATGSIGSIGPYSSAAYAGPYAPPYTMSSYTPLYSTYAPTHTSHVSHGPYSTPFNHTAYAASDSGHAFPHARHPPSGPASDSGAHGSYGAHIYGQALDGDTAPADTDCASITTSSPTFSELTFASSASSFSRRSHARPPVLVDIKNDTTLSILEQMRETELERLKMGSGARPGTGTNTRLTTSSSVRSIQSLTSLRSPPSQTLYKPQSHSLLRSGPGASPYKRSQLGLYAEYNKENA